MRSKWICFFLSVSINTFAYAGTLYGVFKRTSDKSFLFNTPSGQSYKVTPLNDEFITSVSTLEQRGAMIELPDSAIVHPNVVLISEAPFINKAQEAKRGHLKLSSDGKFLLEGETVSFDRTKIVNGAEFDDLSKEHFLGKKVVTRGNRINGQYHITSIMEDGLFSATKRPGLIGTDEAIALHAPFLQNPANYIFKNIPQHKLSSSAASFRGTVFDQGKSVLPGEHVMIFTMSGHQGDEKFAVNGHLAVGLGTVQEDLTIDGEIYNVYIPPFNKKEIVSGSQRLIDYFGHLIGGQNNYRPTYSLILYGIDAEKLKRVRESLELYHAHFRVTDKQMSVGINCGSLTVLALAREGIYGHLRNGKNGTARFPLLPDEFERPTKWGVGKQLKYVFKTPMEEYLPRRIWNSFFKNIAYLNEHEDFGVHRVDYVFYGQTPSSRPRGGIAADELTDDLKAIFLSNRGLLRVD